ncbi:MAG: acyltransferase family protein [Deltaproteobacteria bacterium]|nr:acyltransferase family protein [Deltaproteobacteria bacterium]
MPKNNITVLPTKTKSAQRTKEITAPDTAITIRPIRLSPQAKKVRVINLKKQRKTRPERYAVATSREFTALMKVIEDKFEELSHNYDEKIKLLIGDIRNERKSIARDFVSNTIEKARNFASQFSTQKIKEQISNIAMWATSTEVDEFGLDPIFTAKAKPFFDLLFDKWWRVETIGVDNIPSTGRALLVSNHSGGIPIDGAMIVTSIFKKHPAQRFTRPLVEDFAYYMPFINSFLTKTGSVRASQENAERLLEKDQLVVVFPEGLKGIGKPFKYRYKLQRFGRGGYIKLAMRTRSPIVPVAVVGAEEAFPIIGRIDWLGKLVGAPYLPVTPFFPWFGPLGAIPLPTKWYIKYGEPVDMKKYGPEDVEDDILINRLSEMVRDQIQDILIDLLKHRKSIFFG